MFDSLVRAALLACFSVVFSACSIGERITYSDHEGELSEDVFKTIKSKKADKNWVVAHLGQPFSIDKLSMNTGDMQDQYEVFNYRFTKSHIRAGHLLYVFRAGGKEEVTEYLHVAFVGEMVDEAWVDRLARAPLGERMVKQQTKLAKTQTSNGTPGIVDNENRFAWKLPILEKWFSKPSEDPKAVEQDNAMSADSSAMAEQGLTQQPDQAVSEAPEVLQLTPESGEQPKEEKSKKSLY